MFFIKQITDSGLIRQAMEEISFQSSFSFDVTPFVRLFQFEPGDPILPEGSVASYLFYLVKGRAKLFESQSNGRISLIDFYKAPSFIGEIELLGLCANTSGVGAVTRCDCLALPFSGCRELLLGDPVFLQSLCAAMAKKSLQYTAILTKSHSFPLENRLAAFLLISSHGGVYREKHTEAADYLGVSYRHLLFVLAYFVREGLLEKTGSGYRIADRAALQALADGMK